MIVLFGGKLFLEELIKYANIQNAGIFEEELESLKKYIANLRQNAIEKINLSGGSLP